MRHLNLLIAIAAFIILPIGSYIIFKKRSDKQLKWYVTQKPVRKDVTQYISASGRLKAQDQITVGSLEAGRVVKLHVDDNDFVKKDQVLVEIDDGIGYSAVKKTQAALDQTQASFDYIENFYKRQQILYQSGQLARDTFEKYTREYKTTKAQLDRSQADLEIAQQKYDNLFIKAPEDGVLILKKVDLGEMVTSRLQATKLFIIAKDLTKMEAEIDVDEADIGLVKKGQEAIFTVDSFPQRPFKAQVKQINYGYKIIENVISYAVMLDVDNPELTLRPGMTTNVDIKVASATNALCVPNKALRINRKTLEKIAKKEGFTLKELSQTVETRKQDSLWVMEGTKHFKEVTVTLGVIDGKFRQVLSGVGPDDVIIVEALDPERENPVMTMGKMRV